MDIGIIGFHPSVGRISGCFCFPVGGRADCGGGSGRHWLFYGPGHRYQGSHANHTGQEAGRAAEAAQTKKCTGI